MISRQVSAPNNLLGHSSDIIMKIYSDGYLTLKDQAAIHKTCKNLMLSILHQRAKANLSRRVFNPLSFSMQVERSFNRGVRVGQGVSVPFWSGVVSGLSTKKDFANKPKIERTAHLIGTVAIAIAAGGATYYAVAGRTGAHASGGGGVATFASSFASGVASGVAFFGGAVGGGVAAFASGAAFAGGGVACSVACGGGDVIIIAITGEKLGKSPPLKKYPDTH